MPDLDYNLIKKLFHLGEQVPADFENPVPNITDAKQLADPAMLQQFETLVKKIIEKDDQEVALLGRRVIEDMLLPQYPQLQNEAPEIYDHYQRLIILLKFINLVVRGMPEITSLIEKHLIAALQAGIPIKKRLQEILNVYDDTLLSGTISESLTNALSNSSEKLGTTPLLLKGKNQPVPPTLANWLLDYRISTLQPVGGGEQIATAFDRVTYITRSPNVKKLSKDEQGILLRVFELYDWLRFGSYLLRTGLEEPTAPKFMVRERIVVPPKPAVSEERLAIREKRVLPPAPRPPKVEAERPLSPPLPTPGERGMPGRLKVEEKPFVPPVIKAQPPSPRPPVSPPPHLPSPTRGEELVEGEKQGEQLYRTTLEQLQKAREPREPFSVNEALARAGITPPETQHGEIVPGKPEEQQPSQSPVANRQSPSSDEVDKKLKELEEKIK